MRVTSHGITDIGLSRENNEDRFLIDPSLGMYVVCDGMGGHAGGEVAASIAIRFVVQYFRRRNLYLEEADEALIAELATRAVKQASEEVQSLAIRSPRLAGMGTTLSMLVLSNGKANIANVGDSRVYLIRDGLVSLLTTDQTIRNALLMRGYSPEDPLANGRLSRMLTHCIGEGPTVEVETLSVEVQPGDRFLLCTDGLSECLADNQEVADYSEGKRPFAITRDLVSLAKCRGGMDNITAVIVAVEPSAATDAGGDDTVQSNRAETPVCVG